MKAYISKILFFSNQESPTYIVVLTLRITEENIENFYFTRKKAFPKLNSKKFDVLKGT